MKIEGKMSCYDFAARVLDSFKTTIEAFKIKHKINLVIIEVFYKKKSDASQKYIKNKIKKLSNIGINCIVKSFDVSLCDINDIFEAIKTFNAARYIDGIIIQKPIDLGCVEWQKRENELINTIKPCKDVDGITATNLGKLMKNEHNRDMMMPCTCRGIIEYIDSVLLPNEYICGKKVAIIGRSDIVGKPLAAAFTNENATVTLMHSNTNDKYMKQICKKADIIIVAVGKECFFDESFLNKQKKYTNIPYIFDVGINLVDGEIVGDVCDSVTDYAHVTRVPYGVGQLTIAMLASNVLTTHIKERYGKLKKNAKFAK